MLLSGYLLRHVLLSIIVPITLPKDCRRSCREKVMQKYAKTFPRGMCRRKSFCKHHYNAICDSCQLFFSFFFLLILGKKVAFSGERPRSFCQKNHKILWSQKASATTCSARGVFKMIKLRALTAETFTKKFARGGKFSPKHGKLSPIAALFPHCEGAFSLPSLRKG